MGNGERLFFARLVSSLQSVGRLYVSDGRLAGTELLRGFDGFGFPQADGAALPFANGVAFVGDGDELGVETWYSDGTVAGTQLIDDLVPGAGGSMPLRREPGSWRTWPRRRATERASRASWPIAGAASSSPTTGCSAASCGAPTGRSRERRLVADVLPGPGASDPADLVVVGDRLLFRARAGAFGGDRDLWISDGTTEGTDALDGLRRRQRLPGERTERTRAGGPARLLPGELERGRLGPLAHRRNGFRDVPSRGSGRGPGLVSELPRDGRIDAPLLERDR